MKQGREKEAEEGEREGAVQKTGGSFGIWSINIGGATKMKVEMARREARRTGAEVMLLQETWVGGERKTQRGQRAMEAAELEMGRGGFGVVAMSKKGAGKGGGGLGTAILVKRGLQMKEVEVENGEGLEGVAVATDRAVVRTVYLSLREGNGGALRRAMEEMEKMAQERGGSVYGGGREHIEFEVGE